MKQPVADEKCCNRGWCGHIAGQRNCPQPSPLPAPSHGLRPGRGLSPMSYSEYHIFALGHQMAHRMRNLMEHRLKYHVARRKRAPDAWSHAGRTVSTCQMPEAPPRPNPQPGHWLLRYPQFQMSAFPWPQPRENKCPRTNIRVDTRTGSGTYPCSGSSTNPSVNHTECLPHLDKPTIPPPKPLSRKILWYFCNQLKAHQEILIYRSFPMNTPQTSAAARSTAGQNHLFLYFCNIDVDEYDCDHP